MNKENPISQTVMNSNYIMLKSIRKLKRLMLYKNIKIFEYAINGVEDCKNYEFYFYVNFEKHVYIESLKNKYAYKLKYKIVQLKVQRTI